MRLLGLDHNKNALTFGDNWSCEEWDIDHGQQMKITSSWGGVMIISKLVPNQR